MLPEQPPIVRCAGCTQYYWLRDAKEIGYFWGTEWARDEKIPPECARAPWIEEPEGGEYLQLLRDGIAKDRDEECTLRILAWHHHNDVFRIDPDSIDVPWNRTKPSASDDAEWRKNVEALLQLLDDRDESTILTRAEALRQLGRFEDAIRTVKDTKWERLFAFAHQLREWCEERDTSLRAFKTYSW